MATKAPNRYFDMKGNEYDYDYFSHCFATFPVLVVKANKIIPKAIELGGTTIKSYTSSLGVTGRFQQQLKVHGRKKENCLVCNNQIIVEKVNGRSTYYCEKCQK